MSPFRTPEILDEWRAVADAASLPWEAPRPSRSAHPFGIAGTAVAVVILFVALLARGGWSPGEPTGGATGSGSSTTPSATVAVAPSSTVVVSPSQVPGAGGTCSASQRSPLAHAGPAARRCQAPGERARRASSSWARRRVPRFRCGRDDVRVRHAAASECWRRLRARSAGDDQGGLRDRPVPVSHGGQCWDYHLLHDPIWTVGRDRSRRLVVDRGVHGERDAAVDAPLHRPDHRHRPGRVSTRTGQHPDRPGHCLAPVCSSPPSVSVTAKDEE